MLDIAWLDVIPHVPHLAPEKISSICVCLVRVKGWKLTMTVENPSELIQIFEKQVLPRNMLLGQLIVTMEEVAIVWRNDCTQVVILRPGEFELCQT